MIKNEENPLLKLDPLSDESKEKIKLINKILKARVSASTKEEIHGKWFDDLYEKSLDDLKIYYNVYK